MSSDGRPELSVIICPTTSTPASIGLCLDWLRKSLDGVGCECFVPYDERLDGVQDLTVRYDWVRFLDGRPVVARHGLSPCSHERYNVLRSLALNVARGRIVAILEDHGLPAPDWARAVLAAHRRPDGVIGGVVENRVDRLLNWAVYYCDFGRFQNPVPSGPMRWVTDVNVSYKRECLERVRPVWQQTYREAVVHDAIRAAGHRLVLDGRIVVFQNREVRFREAAWQRYIWGRAFAAVRARGVSPWRRWFFAAFSFGLPLLRGGRVVVRAVRRRRHVDRMAAAFPLVLLLELFWAAGEFMGYVTGTQCGGELEPACAPSPS